MREDAISSGKLLYLDCFSGIAGDMFLGAALDLGVPRDWLLGELRRLPLDDWQLVVGSREHHGIAGVDVQVRWCGVSTGQDVESAPGEGLPLFELAARVGSCGLPDPAVEFAQKMLERLIIAQMSLFGRQRSAVRQAGAALVDTAVDVVGAALALTFLAPAEVVSRVVPLGEPPPACGEIPPRPIPSPIASEILRGLPVEGGGAPIELCTPTGAAIVATSVDRFGVLPAGRAIAVGYGAGDCSLVERPNHLRLILIDPRACRSC